MWSYQVHESVLLTASKTLLRRRNSRSNVHGLHAFSDLVERLRSELLSRLAVEQAHQAALLCVSGLRTFFKGLRGMQSDLIYALPHSSIGLYAFALVGLACHFWATSLSVKMRNHDVMEMAQIDIRSSDQAANAAKAGLSIEVAIVLLVCHKTLLPNRAALWGLTT